MNSRLSATSILIFFAFILISAPSHAIFRVYELTIEDQENGKSRTVQSVLDNYQYPAFHVLGKTETIKLTDSWMCKEPGGQFRSLCPKPDRTSDNGLKSGTR